MLSRRHSFRVKRLEAKHLFFGMRNFLKFASVVNFGLIGWTGGVNVLILG